MFWKDCLLGRIHFSNERFSCQSLFCNDACLATSIFLTRSFQLIWAKENFRLAPSRISWQKVLSHFNNCIENTHPGLFLPLSCRWNYQSSVQVEKETNKEQTNKQRVEAQTSEEQIPNKSCSIFWIPRWPLSSQSTITVAFTTPLTLSTGTSNRINVC